jgi:hypothetical protein
MAQMLLQTPLHDRHVALGARMVPFAGWEMPVQYEGVIPEHRAVRADCGVFDVSHMGEFEVEGPRATELLQAALDQGSDDAFPVKPQRVLRDLRAQVVRINLYWGGKLGVAARRPALGADPDDPAYEADVATLKDIATRVVEAGRPPELGSSNELGAPEAG